jgi:hypothetical protein
MAEHDPKGTRTSNEAHGEWFAKVLGERWQTDGDGIYRLVEEPSSGDVRPEPETTATEEEVVDEIEPFRHVQEGRDDNAPPTRRGRWLRR